MIIRLGQRAVRLGPGGVYAHAFAVDGKAYKVFLSGPEIPPKQSRQGRIATFHAQCKAYELASGDAYLRDHVPTFFGCHFIEDVIDENGQSLKQYYLLDCCYAMEILTGEETKFPRNYQAQHAHLHDAVRRFDELGINVRDASAFQMTDPVAFKFIDFECPVPLTLSDGTLLVG